MMLQRKLQDAGSRGGELHTSSSPCCAATSTSFNRTFAAATKARPMPVLPLVGSTRVVVPAGTRGLQMQGEEAGMVCGAATHERLHVGGKCSGGSVACSHQP